MNNQSFKKIVGAIAVAASLVFMVGCGDDDSPTKTNDDDNIDNVACPASATPLVFDEWADGYIAQDDVRDQWFKFTATAAVQYIHFNIGTLFDVYIRVYDSGCNAVGEVANLYSDEDETNIVAPYSLTNGQTYYIKVTPFYEDENGSGTFQIAFNDALTQPGVAAQDGTQFNPAITYGTLVDSRDGKTYRTVEMPDGKTWMAENLNFETGRGSWCYNGVSAMCDIFGRLYNWTTAMDISSSYNATLWAGNDADHQGICPSDWRLPSSDDWDELFEAVGGKDVAGTKLKSSAYWDPDVSGTTPTGANDYGFSALPGGSRNLDAYDIHYVHYFVGSQGWLWVTTEDTTEDGAGWEDYAACASMNHDSEEAQRWIGCRKISAKSVRCLKD